MSCNYSKGGSHRAAAAGVAAVKIITAQNRPEERLPSRQTDVTTTDKTYTLDTTVCTPNDLLLMARLPVISSLVFYRKRTF